MVPVNLFSNQQYFRFLVHFNVMEFISCCDSIPGKKAPNNHFNFLFHVFPVLLLKALASGLPDSVHSMGRMNF